MQTKKERRTVSLVKPFQQPLPWDAFRNLFADRQAKDWLLHDAGHHREEVFTSPLCSF